MTQSTPPGGPGMAQATNLNIGGGAAIVAPASAFTTGIPQNALVVLPLKPPDDLEAKMKDGAVALDLAEMWKLLGFNGPAVQVTDAQGQPMMIGLDDLIAGLEKNYNENSDDLNAARMFVNELMKHKRFEKAEAVLAKIVAGGGGGEDWLGLGVAQLNQEKWEKAESTLKGAQNLLPGNSVPSLHLAKCFKGQGKTDEERKMVERAISLATNSVEAWAYLFSLLKEADGEAAALKKISELAGEEANKGTAAPFVAVQGFFASDEKTRDKALEWAKMAVDRAPNDSLALVCLSALYGQMGDLQKVIEVLKAHEAKMVRDVRLAHNYFEALFQAREFDKVTKFLNALSGSPNTEVKAFAVERSRMLAQYFQQQQQQLKR